jgi:multidrug efflux pump subunit AcrA (membrane-fusion protein)
MKQGKLLSKVLMLLLIVAIVAYLGCYIWKSIDNPLRTVMSYEQTVNDSVQMTGILVRDETVISGTGTLVEPLLDEGQNVAVGQPVVLLYQNEEALTRKRSIDALEQQKEQLEFAVSSSGSAEESASLDQSILDSVRTLHSSVTAGDLTDLEDNSLTLRSLVLKRSCVYEKNGESSAAISGMIESCNAQINQLSSQAANDTTSVAAPCAGLFSGVVDGYENLITVDKLDSLTAADVQSLLAQTVPANSGGLGKIIRGTTWYFAAVIDEASAARLGSTATLVFSSDFSGEITMTVERVGEAENGTCVVVFSTDHYLAETTLLRCQTVELVFSEQSGVRVPTEALRLDENGQTGVYAVTGIQAEFKPVNIVFKGDGYYLLSPLDAAAENCLRAGDEIIIAAEDIYDGKVVG